MTQGMRDLAAEPDVPPTIASVLKGLKSFSFLGREDVQKQGIDRRGAKVSRIYNYKLVLEQGVVYVEICLAVDGKVADLTPYNE